MTFPNSHVTSRLGVTAALLLTGCTVSVEAGDYVNACQAGHQRCKGDLVQECSPDESGYITATVCGPAERCLDAKCEPISGSAPADAGLDGGAATSDVPYVIDLTIPPLPDAGPSAMGANIDAIARIKVVQALDGGFVDVGFCTGAMAHVLDDAHAVCDGSLFLRIGRSGAGMRAQIYQHESGGTTLAPLLVNPSGDGEPLSLLEGEMVELRFQDFGDEPDDSATRSLSFTLTGTTGGSFAAGAATVPKETLSTFGLWNLETSGTADEVLEGMLAGFSVTLNRPPGASPSAPETLGLLDFLAMASEQGGVVQSPATSPYLDFFVRNDTVGALVVALH